MSNIDWFERVKENFNNMLEKYTDIPFIELYYKDEVSVRFTEFEKDRIIEFELNEPNTPTNILKYSEAESYFYTEYRDTICNCGNDECIAPLFRRRLIIDTAELLVAHIENEIMLNLYALEESLESIPANNVVSIKKDSKGKL